MKFSIISIAFLISVLLLTNRGYADQICPLPVPQKYEHVQPGNVVAAYFANWDTYGPNKYRVQDVAAVAPKLTHLIYAFAKPNVKTGQCELQDPWADVGANLQNRKVVAGNFGKLLNLKKQFPHLKILLSIGGGSHSKEISQIVQAGNLQTFVKSCVELLDEYEYQFKNSKTGKQDSIVFEYPDLFDGLDLDWEWLDNQVPESEAQAFEQMVAELKQLLDVRAKRVKKESVLTVALQVNMAVYKALNLQRCTQFVDWFHVMAYNFTSSEGSGTGFNAPICNPWSSFSIDNAISGMMNEGLSPEKLVLGIPLYGHVFDQVKERLGSPFAKSDVTGSMSYGLIKKNYLQNSACQYKWHSKSMVPYLYCPQEEVFVSFDDERSVKEKVDYAELKRLKGVVFWKLSGDDDNHTLVHVVS